ncbi:hypothetical protein L6452_06602 [Arctium lappa]|uniref:Uncharacterized protein n=1 Tax=Arctium lappa TaxID=4217 RepID=A0ACB9EJD1_ARCLA|nr:hypothetical protein L6452_06602 [Arctium lappa]
MGETHHTNEFYLESMYLDVHLLEQLPEGPTHLKTTSQALLQMAETPPAIVPGDCANGTIAGASSRHSNDSRYNSGDSAWRLCQGHYRGGTIATTTEPTVQFPR